MLKNEPASHVLCNDRPFCNISSLESHVPLWPEIARRLYPKTIITKILPTRRTVPLVLACGYCPKSESQQSTRLIMLPLISMPSTVYEVFFGTL